MNGFPADPLVISVERHLTHSSEARFLRASYPDGFGHRLDVSTTCSQKVQFKIRLEWHSYSRNGILISVSRGMQRMNTMGTA